METYMNERLYNLNQGWSSLAGELLYLAMDQSPYGGILPANELAFYEQRIRANKGPALEQACGTGRLLLRLIERGLDVHGADASADALRFAQIKAKQLGVHSKLYHQRMQDFKVLHRYGTIYMDCGSFMAISERQEAQDTLKRFRNHLIPGGELLIGLFIPDEAKGVPVKTRYWQPMKCASGEGEISTKLWTESFDSLEQTLVEKRRYELKVDGKLVRSELHTLHMRWYYKYEFTMMLEKAGFQDIYLYSDYTEQPATKESKTIIYGARNLST